jgi:integrase
MWLAQQVIERKTGDHLEYVFTYSGRPVKKMNDSAWRNARMRVALEQARVHDLKHTLGARLRVAGVPLEDRQFLLGHESGLSMTTHHSAPELKLMEEYLKRVCEPNNNLVIVGRNTG